MYSFNDAAKGVSKIFTSQILGIVAAIVAVVVAVLAQITIAASLALDPNSTYTAAGFTVILSFVTLVLGIVAFIMQLIGLSNASKDNPTFKLGIYIIVVAIVCSLLANVFKAGILYTLFNAISNLSDLAVMFIVIRGVSELLPNSELVGKGNRIIGLAVAVVIIGIVCNILQSFAILAGLASIVASVCSIIYGILYLIFLSDAKRELQ